MNIVKKLFVQSMIISTSILFLNGINMVIQHFAGNDLTLQWFHPVSIILRDRKKFMIRVSLHCLSLYAIVIAAGRLFGWYTDPESCVSVSIVFFIVYAFVWLSSHWLDKQDEKKINHALDTIRDPE